MLQKLISLGLVVFILGCVEEDSSENFSENEFSTQEELPFSSYEENKEGLSCGLFQTIKTNVDGSKFTLEVPVMCDPFQLPYHLDPLEEILPHEDEEIMEHYFNTSPDYSTHT
jgi:hypothetical protein